MNNAAGVPIIQKWYPWQDVCTEDACTVASPLALAAGNYTWWIQTKNGVGLGPWTPPLNFVTKPPDAPQLVSPSGAIEETVPSFLWKPSVAAREYYLWVNNAASAPVIQQWYQASAVCTGATCSVVSSKTLVGDHTWWIQGKSEVGAGAWSAPKAFKGGVPRAATLISPLGDVATRVPTYRWNRVAIATVYYLWVSNPSSVPVIQTRYVSSAVCTGEVCAVTPSTALVDGEHWWWIQTKGVGGEGPWSAPMRFDVMGPAPPGVPTLVSPTGTVTTRTPSYTWNEVATATDYYLWVNNPSSVPVIQLWYTASSVCGGGTCSVTSPVSLVDGMHTWWIQAKGPGGLGPWSAPMKFTVMGPQPPAAPSLVSPRGAVGTRAPSYVWNEVSTATDYYLWVNNPSGVAVIQQWYAASSVCTGGTCTVAPTVSLVNGNHTWWAQAKGPGGTGPWSAAAMFMVGPPSAPALVSPQGTTFTRTPTYTWNAVATATEYYVWVNNASSVPVIQQWYAASSVCSGATCAVTPSVSLGGGAHTWWVQAKNDLGVGPWSAAVNFTVAAPGAAALVSPQGTITATTPAYRWNAVGGATEYYLWVSNGSAPVIQQWHFASSVCAAGTCSVTPSTSLASGGYTWWIQTKNDIGVGPWSMGMTFTVKP